MSLTYDRIIELADGLGIDVVELFAQDAMPLTSCGVSVTTFGDAPEVRNDHYTYGMANAEITHKQMTPMFGRIRAHSIDEFEELIRHPGEEYTIVLEGSIEVHIEGRELQVLHRHDSIYFDSSFGHAYVSVSESDALVMCVCWRRPSSST